jgi:DNA-3-methyladenine glycosylase II
VWSAETFLVHNLRGPDILPAGDLGIRRAIQAQWHLDRLPFPEAGHNTDAGLYELPCTEQP